MAIVILLSPEAFIRQLGMECDNSHLDSSLSLCKELTFMHMYPRLEDNCSNHSRQVHAYLVCHLTLSPQNAA